MRPHHLFFNKRKHIVTHDHDYEDHDVVDQWSWTRCIWSLTCRRPQAPNLGDDVSPTPPDSPEPALEQLFKTITTSTTTINKSTNSRLLAHLKQQRLAMVRQQLSEVSEYCFWTEYEYYSESEFWPNTNNIRFSEWANTNTNNIRAQIFGRTRIRIIFGFRTVPQYQHE